MKTTMRWPVLAAALLLAACATPPAGSGAAPSREIATESDQTDTERRARTRIELASAYFGRGQATTALDELKLALQIKPDLPEAYNLRGLIYAQRGDEQLAEESFRRALQLDPRDADTMHNFGWLLCQQRRYPDADAQFEQALLQPQYPNRARTLMAQGICLAGSGQIDRAETALVRSYQIDPTDPVAAVNLSEVLYRRGQYERARFYVARVNVDREISNAQTLWLAARIEHKLGNAGGVSNFGGQLRDRFPQSREALALERRAFDEQ